MLVARRLGLVLGIAQATITELFSHRRATMEEFERHRVPLEEVFSPEILERVRRHSRRVTRHDLDHH